MEEPFKTGCLARYGTCANEVQENPMLKSKPIQQTNRFEVLPKLKKKMEKTHRDAVWEFPVHLSICTTCFIPTFKVNGGTSTLLYVKAMARENRSKTTAVVFWDWNNGEYFLSLLSNTTRQVISAPERHDSGLLHTYTSSNEITAATAASMDLVEKISNKTSLWANVSQDCLPHRIVQNMASVRRELSAHAEGRSSSSGKKVSNASSRRTVCFPLAFPSQPYSN